VRERAAQFCKQGLKAWRAALHHGGCPGKAITLAREDIDEIDLDARIGPEVLQRARRADIAECDRAVVQHGKSALGRDVWRAVGSRGRDEAEALLRDDPFHVGREHLVVRLDPDRPWHPDYLFRPRLRNDIRQIHLVRSANPS
jgi:hypothetical protein